MVVVAQDVPVGLQLVRHLAERTAEHGQQHLPALRLPVDVEPAGAGDDGPSRSTSHSAGLWRGTSPCGSGRCPRSVRGRAPGPCGTAPAGPPHRPAPPVRASGPRRRNRGPSRGPPPGRGEVQVGHAELGQVRDGFGGCLEGEGGLELQAVGRRGDCRGTGLRGHGDVRTRVGACRAPAAPFGAGAGGFSTPPPLPVLTGAPPRTPLLERRRGCPVPTPAVAAPSGCDRQASASSPPTPSDPSPAARRPRGPCRPPPATARRGPPAPRSPAAWARR